MNNNNLITNLNQMTKLKFLNICGDCSIKDCGISTLNLEYLTANENEKITDLNHINGQSGVTMQGIGNLKLEELDIQTIICSMI